MCDVLASTVVNCSDPGLVENAIRHEHQNLPEGFEYGVTVVYQCKRGFYLLGSSALTCMANGLWDRSLPKCLGEWGRLAFKEHCQHNICSFFFFNTIEKGIDFLFCPPDPITNHISFYDIFKKARDSVSSAWTLFSLCPLISARFLLQPSRWADPLVHPGASSLQTVPLATRCLPGDPGSEILQKAIVWSLHLWTQYLWPEVWSTLGASLVSSALPGQSSVSLIKKTAPWLALPPDP